MEQGPSWEANRSVDTREIFAFYGKRAYIIALSVARLCYPEQVLSSYCHEAGLL
jgi:hypothetical protein